MAVLLSSTFQFNHLNILPFVDELPQFPDNFVDLLDLCCVVVLQGEEEKTVRHSVNERGKERKGKKEKEKKRKEKKRKRKRKAGLM